MSMRAAACAAALLLLAGCATRLERAEIRQLSSPTNRRLACPLRLAQVVDARPSKEAGLMGGYAYSFTDVTASIREALQALGWSTAAEARAVTISIQKLYLAASQSNRAGVAVFAVQPEGRPAFTVRGQAAGMNWTGSEASGNDVLIDAVAEARKALVVELNGTCGKAGG